jgi:hypothetical protein
MMGIPASRKVDPTDRTDRGWGKGEQGMRRTLMKLTVPLAVLACVGCGVVLANQTMQLVGLVERIHPVLGTALLWTLLTLYALCVAVPLVLFLRLPTPLKPPASEDSPEFPRHLAALGRRLRGNPLLAGQSVAGRAEIVAALSALDSRANEVIRAAASRVFLATAISQNGSLDGLLVLLVQSRMIWQLAHVYYQRPSLRELAYLYGNVAGTALVAAQLDDVDLSEQLQSVLSSVAGSAVGAIPGSTLLVNSMVTGAANAFLSLRVGIIARRYCGALVKPEPRALRRAAVAEAAGMLVGITQDGAKRVAQAFWKASRNIAVDTARGFGGSLKEAIRSLAERFGVAGVGTPDPTPGPEGRGRAGDPV